MFEQFYSFKLYQMYPLFQPFSQFENLTTVSKIFYPSIVANVSTVSIFFSIRKSNRCYSNFSIFGLRPICPLFQLSSQLENLTIVCPIYYHWIVANLSIVSIFFSTGKSNHCSNNFLSFKQTTSLRLTLKILLLYASHVV